MDTIQITITAGEREQEVLISQLDELGANGFEQTPEALIAYFSANRFNSYDVEAALKGFPHETGTIPEQNWNAVWESNFQPVVVDDFCAVRADFHTPITGVQYEMIITPKMSFGTGHHATTYMMMEQMRHLHFSNSKVLDFGTGTGILAILAEKLGAAAIEGIDVDAWSIENANENIQRNNCSRITLELGAQLPAGPFDIILANINRNVLLDYMHQLKKALVPGGKILLSGLLREDEAVINGACEKEGLVYIRGTEQNNWVSLLYERKSDN